jgi:glycosyltransferase involved in cell wall biosynthesis
MLDEAVWRATNEERIRPAWLDRACVVVPAYDAEASIAGVVRGLRDAIPELAGAIFVVDDGSRDATARVAHDLGCVVLPSDLSGGSRNRGKGAALRAGFEAARIRGMTVALTVDADGQHPPEEARRLLFEAPNERSLVVGVRNLARDGAPRQNQLSNRFSNWVLSRFAGRELLDTQCGLRRYPIGATLALGARATGYDFEAELLLRAVWSGLEIVELPVKVLYPEDRRTHFRVSRDPWLIVRTVLRTVGEHWLSQARRRSRRGGGEVGDREGG